MRLTGQTSRICLVSILDKKDYRAGSQINGARRTERPDLLRTGDDAVAAKTAGNDSPVQPHSGTLGHTSFTCKEGGERDDREVVDGNEIEDTVIQDESPSDD